MHDVLHNPQYQIVDLTSAGASVQDVCAGFKDDYAKKLHLAAQKRDETRVLAPAAGGVRRGHGGGGPTEKGPATTLTPAAASLLANLRAGSL